MTIDGSIRHRVWLRWQDGSMVGMIKRLTVSTGQLKAFLPLHLPPINPVVYRGSFVLRHATLILRGASRLYAFSVYPCPT